MKLFFNNGKNMGVFSVDDESYATDISNANFSVKYLKFLLNNSNRPSTDIAKELVVHISESLGVEVVATNSQQLDKFIVDYLDDLFILAETDETINDYLKGVFNYYKAGFEKRHGNVVMIVTNEENSQLEKIKDVAFNHYNINNLHVYSFVKKESCKKLLKSTGDI